MGKPHLRGKRMKEINEVYKPEVDFNDWWLVMNCHPSTYGKQNSFSLFICVENTPENIVRWILDLLLKRGVSYHYSTMTKRIEIKKEEIKVIGLSSTLKMR